MRRIIGLYGKKGVGKNFVADRIAKVIDKKTTQPESPPYRMFAFADPIKRFCVDALGLPGKACYGNDQDKATLTDYDWGQMPFSHQKTGRMTVREVMQVVGTELGRNIWGKGIWADCLTRNIGRYLDDPKVKVAFAIVTDVRFPNEVEAIKQCGGKVWVIRGPQRIARTSRGDEHESEKLQDDMCGDAIILNDRGFTERDIDCQVEDLINREFKK